MELLTVTEVAKELRLSEEHVRVLVRQGKLTTVRLGERGIRFRRQDLHEFIESRVVTRDA